MAAPGPEPSALRASDADREHVIRVLRDGSVDGRLSHDTFVRRVDAALRARGGGELAELLGDLPPPGRVIQWVARAVAWWSAFTAQLQAAWRGPRLRRLVLPRADGTVFTIGRAEDCDLVVGDLTVSGHHAELRRIGDGWVLADLGSLNGTRVNGWRVGPGFVIRAGDWVEFGRAGFRLADHQLSRLDRIADGR